MDKQALLELIKNSIEGQGNQVDAGGALAGILTELTNGLAEVAANDGITVALDCPIINPNSDELYYTFDVAGLSSQINYYINTEDYIDLRKYFSRLNADVEYGGADYINLHLDYTWDDGGYFGASSVLGIEKDPEVGELSLVVGEMNIDQQADRYTSDFETIIKPLLRGVLGELSPAKVLKIGKNVIS